MPRMYGTQASQAGPSRRRRVEEEEPEEEENQSDVDEQEYAEQDEGDQSMTQTKGTGGLSEDQLKSAAAQLVRLALFNEYKKRPLPRAEISQKILKDHPRALNAVLDRARRMLKSNFGMDQVELRPKYRPSIDGQGENEATQANRDGEGEGETRPTKRSKNASAKSYGLRSVLPADLLKAMSEPRPLPFIPPDDDDESHLDGDNGEHLDSGALLRWEKGDSTASGNVELLGMRTMILCLVLVMGRVISDDHLHALLRRLNLYRDTVLPYPSPDRKEALLTLDRYLELLAKQNYLEKIKIPGPSGAQGEGESAEWRWGSRADLEFSEKAAAQFMEIIFTITEMGGSEEETTQAVPTAAPNQRDTFRDSRDKEAEAIARRSKLRNDIEKAAGSALTGEL